MDKFLPILKNCVLFDGIESTDIPGLLRCLGAGVRHANKNERILSQGEAAAYVGILLSGNAHVVREDFYGRNSIVGHVQAAEMFGESFACAGVAELPVSVVANADSAYMLIDCRRITTSCCNACGFHSRMIFNLLKAVAARNLEFHRKLEITARRTTREKLVAYLLLQAKENGSSSFTIPFDRQGLADYLGVERSAMSAELSKLRRDGVIDFQRSRFTIKQIPGVPS